MHDKIVLASKKLPEELPMQVMLRHVTRIVEYRFNSTLPNLHPYLFKYNHLRLYVLSLT